jgi:hypothetical protein
MLRSMSGSARSPQLRRYLELLETAREKLPHTKPQQAHAFLYDAFRVAALAGDFPSAGQLVRVMYGSTLAGARKPIRALSTHALDIFCHVNGFGEVTRGKPMFAFGFVALGALPQRVAAIERGLRLRLTSNMYAGDFPIDDAWRKRPTDDPWFMIDRWRRVQALLSPAEPGGADEIDRREKDALGRLEEILTDGPESRRAPGQGAELVIGFDLAFRHRLDEKAASWLEAHGDHVWDVADELLCSPTIVQKMKEGFFRANVGINDTKLAAACTDLARAAEAIGAASRSGKRS